MGDETGRNQTYQTRYNTRSSESDITDRQGNDNRYRLALEAIARRLRADSVASSDAADSDNRSRHLSPKLTAQHHPLRSNQQKKNGAAAGNVFILYSLYIYIIL